MAIGEGKRNLKNQALVKTYLEFISTSRIIADFWYLIQKVTYAEEPDSEKETSNLLLFPSPQETAFISLVEKDLRDPKFSELEVLYKIINPESPPLVELQEKDGLINYAKAKFGEPSPYVINFLCRFFVDQAKNYKNSKMAIKLIREYQQYIKSTGETPLQEDCSLESEHKYKLIQAGNRQGLSEYLNLVHLSESLGLSPRYRSRTPTDSRN